jgi:uncharacterized membrane protein (UPF0127 family)
MKRSSLKNQKASNPKISRNHYLFFVIIIWILGIGYIFLYTNNTKTKIVSDGDHGKVEYGNVIFHSPEGEKIAQLYVEIAEDEYEQVTGLMYREDLTENLGMIFLYPDENYRSFWMKNTPTSLDIIFVNAKKEIVHIAKYTKTMSEQLYHSKYPAMYVVETIAGYTDLNDIRIGSKIQWERESHE